MGAADIIYRHGGGDRLAIGKRAERIQAGRFERLGQSPPGDKRCRGYRFGRALSRPLAKIDQLRRQHLRRLQPPEQRRKFRFNQHSCFKKAGGDIDPRGTEPILVPGQSHQQVRPPCLQQGLFRDRARRDDPDHFALDRQFPRACLRVLHLLNDGNPKAAPDQAREVDFRSMVGNAAHRDRCSGMLAAVRQGDIESGGRGFGVGKEQLIEIAHPEEQQRVGLFGLGRKPLRHRWRCPRSRGHLGRGVGNAVHPPLSRRAFADEGGDRRQRRGCHPLDARGRTKQFRAGMV